jgi:hypothetical protein
MRGLSTTTGEKELTIVVRWLKAHNPKAYQMLRDDLLGEDDWQELIAGFPTVNCAPEFSIPPDWTCDETRELEKVNLWDDAGKYADAVERSYRRNNWTTQPYHCEIWCEKATVLGSIRPITEKWGVGLRVTHGFASTGMEQNIGDLFEDIDKPIMIFFLGDHDPSGHDLERDIHERAQKATGKKFEMRRLAIFPEDIKRFHLPPQRIKNTDVRSTEFRKKYGANAATVELDALPPDELRQRIEASIMGLIDFDDWDRQVNVQTEELKSIKEFANTMKNLPPPPEEARP